MKALAGLLVFVSASAYAMPEGNFCFLNVYSKAQLDPGSPGEIKGSSREAAPGPGGSYRGPVSFYPEVRDPVGGRYLYSSEIGPSHAKFVLYQEKKRPSVVGLVLIMEEIARFEISGSGTQLIETDHLFFEVTCHAR